jgi:hypothetical protein
VGFAVFEGDMLIDWGLKVTRRADNGRAVQIIRSLISRLEPDVLALEDWEANGARRCDRIQKLIRRIAEGECRRLRVRLVRPHELWLIGPPPDTATKHGRASYIAERFPELQASLPPFRKAYMPEDDRMAIFDAAGFALACFRAQPPASPKGNAAAISSEPL